MTTYLFFPLAVWFFLRPVLGESMFPTATSIISLETSGPLALCDGFGLCERSGGGVYFGETMEKHVFPHAIWIESEGVFYNYADPTNSTNFTDPLQLQIGDIVAFEVALVPRLYSAALETAVNPWIGALCIRRIFGPGRDFGYLIVEPPVADPDTLFQSIAQDPLLDGLPSGLRSELDPALVIPSPTIGCQRKKCYQFIEVSSLNSGVRVLSPLLIHLQSADVFYFGPDPTNTACLSAITSSPPLPTPPPISMYIFITSELLHSWSSELTTSHRDPSSVYVVYQPIVRFDNCRTWLGENFGFTASFRSDTLSTLEYRTDAPPATKAMNYADLSCPPPEIAQYYNPQVPYSPILKQLFRTWASINGSDESCEQVGVRDPPVKAVRVDRISGSNDGGGVIA